MRPHPTLSPVAATKLIKSYCNKANTALARNLFDLLPHRDVVTWSAMISGYTSNGHHNEFPMVIMLNPEWNNDDSVLRLLQVDGKPIQVAAARNNREVVELLFPLTSPLPNISNWSVDRLIEYMQSKARTRLESYKREASGVPEASMQKLNIVEAVSRIVIQSEQRVLEPQLNIEVICSKFNGVIA